ncbi:MAG: hypothetical protein EHM49_00105 [Deltaproteobacteria bacterium]|nr:MAG: hypothetical protein EHM49_09120 [Deltaproteobacteria bacterium]RPI56429.1 MAG: hypothetical protein EHM49_00105 [Deltaproteobacteria bacterium]
MPTYRNDGSVTYKVRDVDRQKQVVQPGESIATPYSLAAHSDFVKTLDAPANPASWNITVAVGSTFADNLVDIGAVLKAKSGHIRTSATVNMRFNSPTGDMVVFDVTAMGYIWEFTEEDDFLVDKIYFENPPISGAVDIYVEVVANSR